jgi:hypothetical protein
MILVLHDATLPTSRPANPANAARRQRVNRLLKARGKTKGLDMEPFEAMRDMIRANEYPLIGGPPQIFKVYRHLNSAPLGVYWPEKASKRLAIGGRPLMDYEVTRFGVMDPDTLESEPCPPATVLPKPKKRKKWRYPPKKA